MASLVVILVLSYLAGSIPGSVWVGKGIYGIDVREYGSGNAGATNVFRVLGWKAGMLSAFVDLGKGLLAAGLIATIRLDSLPYGYEFWHVETMVRAAAGVAAIVGHMFPVWGAVPGRQGRKYRRGRADCPDACDDGDRARGIRPGTGLEPVRVSCLHDRSGHVSYGHRGAKIPFPYGSF